MKLFALAALVLVASATALDSATEAAALADNSLPAAAPRHLRATPETVALEVDASVGVPKFMVKRAITESEGGSLSRLGKQFLSNIEKKSPGGSLRNVGTWPALKSAAAKAKAEMGGAAGFDKMYDNFVNKEGRLAFASRGGRA